MPQVWDWDAAVDRKNAAIAQLAPLSGMLDDVDSRINELLARASRIERLADEHPTSVARTATDRDQQTGVHLS